MFVLLEAGRFVYGDILIDLITSLFFPEADLRLKVGLYREPRDITTWLSVISGMTVATFLLVAALLALLISALYIPLPYEICDRSKVQFFELLLRLSNEHLGHVLETLFGPKPPKWCDIRNEVIGGTRCRVYMPDQTKKTSNTLLIFIHGGGFCIMRPDHYDGPMLSLIKRTGTPIVSVDYTLSPEVRFPFAINECESLVREIYYKKHADLGINPEQIVIMGDSAGGNLTAVLCQRFLRAKLNIVKCQILVYPYYYRSYNKTALLNPHSLARWYLMYLGIEASKKNIKLMMKNKHLPRELLDSSKVQAILDYHTHLPELFIGKGKYSKPLPLEPDEQLSAKCAPFLSNPEICPILADDMEGLPQALVMTAGVDILRDEGVLYAKRLRQFNVPTKWNHYEAAFHGVLNMPRSKQRLQMINDIHSYLSEQKLL
ncbi:Arylacetamide deacetylase [Aphelenchoides fujianensis]|nr:Arylacetamide deacetylase [Aphelenchoides fujianensis]